MKPYTKQGGDYQRNPHGGHPFPGLAGGERVQRLKGAPEGQQPLSACQDVCWLKGSLFYLVIL